VHRVGGNSAGAKAAVAKPQLAKSIRNYWGGQGEEIHCGDPSSPAPPKGNV